MMHNLIMNRLATFLNLKEHAMLGKAYKKLSEKDLTLCKDFILKHETLDKNAYASKVLRLWMDNSNKPKLWKEIEELLICSN